MSSSPTTINTVPLPPAVPTASATVQPTCATPSGTITITTQSGVEYSVNGTVSVLEFICRIARGYTLYVSLTDPSCVTISGSTSINSIPPPVVPTTAVLLSLHVLCNLEVVLPQSGVEYSLDGTTYQASNTFQA
jgi:hypothetical protein